MFCVGIFAHTTDDRNQTTCGQHNATCTTLPHSSSRIHHVRARGVSSLCCGELLSSKPVICHPTIPHLSAVLPLRGRADWSRNFERKYRNLRINLDTKQSLQFSQQRQIFTYTNFYGDYLPTSQMTTHQTKCGKHDAACMTLSPSIISTSTSTSRQDHVRVPYPLYTAAGCFCDSLSCKPSCSVVLDVLFTLCSTVSHIPRHRCGSVMPPPFVPYLASWRSLSKLEFEACPSPRNHKEISYKRPTNKCCVLRVFSEQRQQIAHGHVYIDYPKSAKSTAIEYTQEVLRLNAKSILFPNKFSGMYK